ncbi:hypothetical protein AMTRI_Chr07g76130 [Amborella trichopoda]
MLFQVGGHGKRPTFFEMAATQQLPPSLRAALTYSFGVLAQRRPFFHKVLDYDDEFFAMLMIVLETHSLRTTEASFSESLYGLRRRSAKLSQGKEAPHTDSVEHSGIEKHQKILSVVFLVVLPYFKSKLHSVYRAQRDAMLQDTLWGAGDVGMDESDGFSERGENLHIPAELTDNDRSRSARVKNLVKRIISACYPWIHATNEGLSFAYQLLYLLDATSFYSPALHILTVNVCRATGQELMDASSKVSKNRMRERERLWGPAWLKAVQGVLLSSLYRTLDYAQTGLIAAVFFFKMMEWWYQSAEERMTAPTVYPPPPPPPPPKVADEGIPLPPDRTLCPLCTSKRTNPAVVAASGFVFCYSCIFKYVSRYKRCPVTLMPVNVDQIRRLFHDV